MLPGSRSHGSVLRHSGAVAVGFMPDVGEPPAHLEVHRLSTDYGFLRERPVPRHEHERVGLRSAQTSVRADEFLEGSHLSGFRPVSAVYHDIGAIRETVSAFDVLGRVGTEGRKRVLSFYATFIKKAKALLADNDRPVLLGASEHETDARMVPQRGDDMRVALVDPFQRDPPGLPREGDKPEAAGGQDDDLRWYFPLLLTPYLFPFLLAYDDGSVDRPPLRRPPYGPGDGAVATRRLRQRGAQVPHGFVAWGCGLDALGGTGSLHEMLQRRAVAILECRPLGLAVVGQNDQTVRAGRILNGRFDPCELPVDLAQGGERIRALYPRVVGNLVVAEERRVGDRTPGIEISDQRLHLEVALDHRRPRPDQGIGKVAV